MCIYVHLHVQFLLEVGLNAHGQGQYEHSLRLHDLDLNWFGWFSKHQFVEEISTIFFHLHPSLCASETVLPSSLASLLASSLPSLASHIRHSLPSCLCQSELPGIHMEEVLPSELDNRWPTLSCFCHVLVMQAPKCRRSRLVTTT